MGDFFKRLISPDKNNEAKNNGMKNNETKSKKKVENLVVLIVILIITLVIMNTIWNGDTESEDTQEENASYEKVLAETDNATSQDELEQRLEEILSTIKNVGDVKVLLNYSESSSVVPIYDETTTTSTTEEEDSSGGTRNVTETETQKDVVFSENDGDKDPVIQKTTMPVIEGAIVTAEGGADATVKTNIINAVAAVTGLSIDRIQVFQMENVEK